MSNKVTRKKKLNYKKYLLSKHWKSFSKSIRIKRKVCEHCGIDRKLNVHHLHYNTIGREQPCDVLLLCRRCHKIVHGIRITKRTVKKAERKTGKKHRRKYHNKRLNQRVEATKNEKCIVCGLPKVTFSKNGYFRGSAGDMCIHCFKKWGGVKNWREQVNKIKKGELLVSRRANVLEEELNQGLNRAIEYDNN